MLNYKVKYKNKAKNENRKQEKEVMASRVRAPAHSARPFSESGGGLAEGEI